MRLRDEARIVRVQDQRARVPDGSTDDPFDLQQFVEIAGTEIAEMVFRDIRDQGRVRFGYTEAAPQQTATRRLENGCIDVCVPQHFACAPGPGPVISIDDSLANRDVIGRTESCIDASGCQDVCGKSNRGCLAIRPCHQRERYIPVIAGFERRRVRQGTHGPGR